MASKKELKALITLAGKVDPSLQKSMLNATKSTNNLKESFRNTGSVAKNVFQGIMASKLVSTAINGLKSIAGQALESASDLMEVQNVVDTTFKASASEINKWSKGTLDAYGLSELKAKTYSGTLGAMMKSSGLAGNEVVKLSKDLVGLSGDMSSFYNLDSETAFEKIKSGLSGETEPLKALGINLSATNLEAYALSKGIKTAYSSMKESDKYLLRYSYLMDVTKDAQGDFLRTQDGYANQQSLSKENFKNMTTQLASGLIPTLAKGYKYLNKFMKGIDVNKISKGVETIANKGEKLIGFIGEIGSRASPFLKVLKDDLSGLFKGLKIKGIIPDLKTVGDRFLKIADNLLPMYERVKKVGFFIKDNWGTISPIVAGIATSVGLVVGKMLLLKGVSAAKKGIGALPKLFTGVSAAVGFLTSPFGIAVIAIGLLVAAGLLLYKNWDKIKAKAAELTGAFRDKFPNAFNFISEKFGIFKETISGVIGGLKKVFGGLTEFVSGVFTGDWGRALGGLKTMAGGHLDIFKSLFKGSIDNIKSTFGFLSNYLEGKFPNTFNFLSERFQIFKETSMGIFEGLKDIFKGFIGFISGVFTLDFDKAFSGIKDMFSGYKDIFKSIAEGMVDNIKNAFGFLKNIFNPGGSSIEVKEAKNTSNKKTSPKLPLFASGGITKGVSIAGEAGPEMIIPLKRNKRSLDLLKKTAQMLSFDFTNPKSVLDSFSGLTSGAANVVSNNSSKKAGEIHLHIHVETNQANESGVRKAIEETTPTLKAELIRLMKEIFDEEGSVAFE